MMDVTQKSATLEDLLRRVQSNRVRLAAERSSATAPVATAAPRVPSMPALPPRVPSVPAPLSLSPTPIATPRPQSVPPIEKRITVSSPPPVAISAPPAAPMPTAPPPEQRVFESTPTASGDVAYIEGQAPQEWTLAAVLRRAFRLGQRS